MRKFAWIAALLLASCTVQHDAATPTIASTAPQSTGRCAALVGRDFGRGIAITDASEMAPAAPGTVRNGPGGPLASGLPAYCSVKGVIDQRTGAGGKTYGIKFALALPDHWSGRFLLMGGGGLNGSVPAPYGPVAAGAVPALARGFAVVGHDSGHEGAVFDDSFSKDQRAALDFAETSVHTVTVAAKSITSAYYGQPIARSYMTGCSTGGREGMLAIERYPELFDGVVIGAPAMRTGDSNLALAKLAVDLNQAAPRDKDGLPIVSQIFSASDRATILKGMLDQCDSLDGLADGMIENVAQCHFQPKKLICAKGQTSNCLSGAQADALDKAFQPPRDAAGNALYAPYPYDTGDVSTGPGLPGIIPTGAPGVFGPASRDLAIDVDARIRDVRANAMQRLTDTNYWTNLNTFLDHGGKTLFYHGVSDFWFSPLATWDWYQRAAQTNGAAFTDASRFYMVPGMLHCQGGNSFDQFDLLSKMVDWVEKGEAPHDVIASRRDGSARRPLCPYPSHAQYRGGDATKPDSFECRAPEGA
ncbi:MAG: tannase/feruloyl esterase family alpha/beta hydrolase [Croceibacterium sp.]